MGNSDICPYPKAKVPHMPSDESKKAILLPVTRSNASRRKYILFESQRILA
jgi:hypothetical protein